MSSIQWRKSSYSNGSGGTCVELAYLGAVRDSKNPAGPMITVPRAALAAFVSSVQVDHFQ